MKDLFKKDVFRDINGVIKVGQLTDRDVRQELEEYVITKELAGYFDAFYRHYVNAISEPTDKIGVWVSGFFGSGKSHFLKILSYLLDNREVAGKPALEYFEPKVSDPMLLAAMQRAAEAPKDVLLFNIDSKADASSKADKEAIVKVFMKVFNEHLGYFGTSPEIADFERRLAKQGKYQAFKDAYQRAADEPWEADRENWDFREEEIITALQDSLGMSAESASNFFDRFGESYSLSVERFAKIVKEYLDSQPGRQQIVFMVDEVGQYIGENPDLMLNLQTVAEDVGTICEGQAWIVVTSQEDIDGITKDRVKGNDFSKIQGRFKTRISLSSANTDEVIRLRLLEKNDDGKTSLQALYAGKEQSLKNQIRFSSGTADMPSYHSAEDFVSSYPFVPYQFKLLQKVFTQIRLHGASGKHLSQGERSMLDGFQLAAQQVATKPLGSLGPFHSFYRAIQGFLDSTIKTVIDQAAENSRLESFDVDLLKTLFMIKYVKEIKGTIENLTSVSLSHVDEDRLALNERVQAALARLERETLIQRNGEVYEFLTNEEQDVGREIKNHTLNPGEVQSELQKIIWEEIFTTRKYRYDNRHDYGFNRKLDGQNYGTQTDDLTLHIVTPQADEYQELAQDANALMRSGAGGVVIVRLPDERSPFDELAQYVKTDRYVKRKHGEGISTSVRSILQARTEGNRERRERVVTAIEHMLANADVFVMGNRLESGSSSASAVLTAGLKNLVDNTYTKLNYIKSPLETEEQIEQALREGPGGAQTLEGETPNALAQSEMHRWLNEQQSRHQTVTLRTLEQQFSGKPYGWARRDIQGVLAELLAQGKAELRQAQSAVDLKTPGLLTKMGTKQGLDSFTVRVPQQVNPEALRIARELAQEYLSLPVVPTEPQALYERYRSAISSKSVNVHEHLALAKQGGYPFQNELEKHQDLLEDLKQTSGAAALFDRLRQREEDFEQMAVESEKIESFFGGQREAYDRAKQRLATLEPELSYLNDDELRQKVEHVREIISKSDPTGDIPELTTLLSPVEEHLRALREERKQRALEAWRQACSEVTTLAKEQQLPEHELPGMMQSLSNLQDAIANAQNIDAIIARQASVDTAKQQATQRIIARLNEISEETKEPETPKAKPISTVRPADLTKKTVLESEEEIEAYVSAVRDRLLAEYKAGNRLRIE